MSTNMNNMNQTGKIVMAGLMTALVIVSIMVIRFPIPGTTGYIHLGDGILFLGVFILGWRYGAFAGGVGAGLADLLVGAAVWAPWTLVIKGGMALIVGLMAERHPKLGMLLATVWMVVGYYAAEGIIYGNWAAPIIGVPWNIAQGLVGLALASVLASALEKTSAKRYFTYKI